MNNRRQIIGLVILLLFYEHLKNEMLSGQGEQLINAAALLAY